MSVIQFPISYPALIEGTPYENAPPLPTTIRSDGKSLENPPPESISTAYNEFPDPLDKRPGKAAFDVHVYYHEPNKKQKEFARSLWERIRYEFPELRVYRFWERPIGPHLTAMFEVNLFTPAQFGAFIPWLMLHRGPLSVLVHPNTGHELHDHTVGAVWLGEKLPLDVSILGLREISG
ncbi:hypothetical protein TWF225_009015 [Orbilia oligospora]|uniref:Uncharacterized protein n=1 Tax=Orbilia oligospora TaxID=2813651 RepID=A0A7C8PDQ2_ORBOL|nr:hypothetical protein TWF751_006229 [Orbilia oligospora]KAF3175117.1 hypothetical protein TWF225_009015 [Orbilia oligospora]KAF3234565.1 hypothetical protein TWF128_002300 [Orbilia oligospora]KAF3248676.1 hypothetical protein TWF217_009035 [Orbilia oligospora]KAF3281743.1 hypothetical protein TWF132_011158 [Orbilia oligospora]